MASKRGTGSSSRSEVPSAEHEAQKLIQLRMAQEDREHRERVQRLQDELKQLEENASVQKAAQRMAKYKDGYRELKKECKSLQNKACHIVSHLKDARLMHLELEAVSAERTLCAKTALNLNEQLGLLDQSFGSFKAKWSDIRKGNTNVATVPSSTDTRLDDGAGGSPGTKLFRTRPAYELVRKFFVSLEEEDFNVIPQIDDSLYYTGPMTWYPACVSNDMIADIVAISSDEDSATRSGNADGCLDTIPPASLDASVLEIGGEFLEEFTGCNCVHIGLGVGVETSQMPAFQENANRILGEWSKLHFRKIDTSKGSQDLRMFVDFAKYVSKQLWPGPTFDVAASSKHKGLGREFHTGRVQALEKYLKHCVEHFPGGAFVDEDTFHSFFMGVTHQLWLLARRDRNKRLQEAGWRSMRKRIEFVDDAWIEWFQTIKHQWFNKDIRKPWPENFSGFEEPSERGTI